MFATCFRQNATLIKCVAFAVSVLVMIAVALALRFGGSKGGDGCNSEPCINALVHTAKYVDDSINPCENFFAFVCGRHSRNKKRLLPEEELNQIISSPMESDDDETVTLQKLFYRSCLNLVSIEIDNDETILNLIYKLGDLPVLRGFAWDGTNFDWVQLVMQSRDLGLKFDWFLDFSVSKASNGRNVLKIDVPRSSRLFGNDSSLEILYTNVVKTLGASDYPTRLEMKRTVHFEAELEKLIEYHSAIQPSTSLSGEYNISYIQTLWANTPWLEFVNAVSRKNMTRDDIIIFPCLNYIKDLNQLIMGTPKRIVADYMLMKIVEELWPFLSSSVRSAFKNSKLYDHQLKHTRQELCLTESTYTFPLVAESAYIRRHVTKHKKELIVDILTAINNYVIRLVQESSELKAMVREEVLIKLETLTFQIGGPDVLFNPPQFATFMGLDGFTFKSRNIIDMFTQRKISYFDKYFSTINTYRVDESPPNDISIKEFALINDSTLGIPAYLLTTNLFDPKLPKYMNYASIGKVLTKKILEFAFDIENQVSLNDSWTLSNSVECLKNTSLYWPDLELLDFMAGDVSYETYQGTQHFPKQKDMEKFHFTPNQLYWIHANKIACLDENVSETEINGPLRNSMNFAREFNCTKGSKMNPVRKCRIL